MQKTNLQAKNFGALVGYIDRGLKAIKNTYKSEKNEEKRL